MTKDTTKEAAVAAEACFWMIGSTRSRTGFGLGRAAIETMLEEELSEALSRPRYGRRKPGEDEAVAIGCWRAPRASRADADGHVWQDADRRAARSVDRRGRQDARMAEPFVIFRRGTRAADALIAGAYLAGTNTAACAGALNAVFAGPVGKDVVSRVWRKTKGDWDAWNARSLAEQPIVRLILDSTVARVRLIERRPPRSSRC